MEDIPKPKKIKNDVKDLKSFRMLEKVDLDLDSPRFAKACESLGITKYEC